MQPSDCYNHRKHFIYSYWFILTLICSYSIETKTSAGIAMILTVNKSMPFSSFSRSSKLLSMSVAVSLERFHAMSWRSSDADTERAGRLPLVVLLSSSDDVTWRVLDDVRNAVDSVLAHSMAMDSIITRNVVNRFAIFDRELTKMIEVAHITQKSLLWRCCRNQFD